MSDVQYKPLLRTFVGFLMTGLFFALLATGPVLFLLSLYLGLFTPAPLVETLLSAVGPLSISVLVFLIIGYMVVGPRPP